MVSGNPLSSSPYLSIPIGKTNPVLVNKYFKRFFSHNRMMFKNSMKADYRNFFLDRTPRKFFCACGMPTCTQPGQSIWKECSTTTFPSNEASVIGSNVLIQSEVCNSGARPSRVSVLVSNIIGSYDKFFVPIVVRPFLFVKEDSI